MQAREAMDICLRVLKESNKLSRFDSYNVKNSVLIVSHITFRDCRVHIFSDNLSRNSCISLNFKLPGQLFYAEMGRTGGKSFFFFQSHASVTAWMFY